MRLSRGKVVLRRLLASELRDAAAAYDLTGAGRRLARDAGVVRRVRQAQAPHAQRAAARVAHLPLPRLQRGRGLGHRSSAGRTPSSPVSSEISSAQQRSSSVWPSGRVGYFGRRRAGTVECTRCGRPRRSGPTCGRRIRHETDTAAVSSSRCTACGEEVSSSIAAVALARPEVRSSAATIRGCALCPSGKSTPAAYRPSSSATRMSSGPHGIDVVFAARHAPRARGPRPDRLTRRHARASPPPRLRLLWFGGLVSIAGDYVLHAALPYFVYAPHRARPSPPRA